MSFDACASLTRGSDDRTSDDRQSIPKPSRLLDAGQPPDNLASPEQTKRVDRCAGALIADLGGRGSPKTCGRPFEPPAERRVAASHRVAKKTLNHARSRTAIELCVRGRGHCLWVPSVCGLCLVEDRAQGRPTPRVVKEAFPGCVAVQFGQQPRQVCYQFLLFRQGKVLDSRLDLLHSAHSRNLCPLPIGSKPAPGFLIETLFY